MTTTKETAPSDAPTLGQADPSDMQPPHLKTIIGHLALSLLTAIVIPGVLFYV